MLARKEKKFNRKGKWTWGESAQNTLYAYMKLSKNTLPPSASIRSSFFRFYI